MLLSVLFTQNLYTGTAFIINIFATLNLLMLSAFLFFRKRNSLPNYVLGLIVFLPSINFSFNLLLLSEIVIQHPKLILISTSVVNTLFPLLVYLYIRLLSGKSLRNKKIYIPWVILVISSIYFQVNFVSLSSHRQFLFVQSILNGKPPLAFLQMNIVFFVTMIIYGYLSVILARKNYRQVKSDSEKDFLTLGRAKFIRLFSIMALGLTILIVASYLIVPYNWVEFIVLPLAMSIVFFLVVFSAQKSASIFSVEEFKAMLDEKVQKNKLQDLAQVKKVYPNLDVDFIFKAIEQEISQEVYLDPNLSLLYFSEKYGVPKTHFSNFIKEYYQLSFSDFINKHRVEYAQKMLTGSLHDTLTLEGVGKNSGFNSRVSFYRAFKRFTSVSPSEYINKER